MYFAGARRTALLAALPLLLGAAGETTENCPPGQERKILVPPVLIVGISHDPLPLVDQIVVAHEVMQVAFPGWLLGAELRVPGPERLVYPAGTPLGQDLCLPSAPPPPRPLPPGVKRVRTGTYLEVCLADADASGAHRRLDIFIGNSTMHMPTRGLLRSETPLRPQVLVEDPFGLPESRRYIHRRVRVSVKDKIARLRVVHAYQDWNRYGPPGEYVAGPEGETVFRLVPQKPVPVSMTGNGYNSSKRDAGVSVRIADGAETEVGGLRFRIDRYPDGFMLKPVGNRYPPWIRYGCGRFELGVGPKLG